MYTLFHHPMSTGSRMVRLILGEYGLETTLHEEAIWDRREAFLDVNPAATLPVMADGDRAIIGAQVCAEYLDETQGPLQRGNRLFPEDALARAEMRRLNDWMLDKLENEVVRYVVRERVTKRLIPEAQGGGPPDSQALRAARTNIRYHLQYIDWLAGTRNWLGGSSLSCADMAAAASLSVLDYLGEVDWADHSALKDWYARMKSRPAFRSLLSDRLRGIPPVSHYVDLDF
ncbi:MAG: glutathione S-transferase family protein [Pseudomonadota bacterium]